MKVLALLSVGIATAFQTLPVDAADLVCEFEEGFSITIKNHTSDEHGVWIDNDQQLDGLILIDFENDNARSISPGILHQKRDTIILFEGTADDVQLDGTYLGFAMLFFWEIRDELTGQNKMLRGLCEEIT